LPRITNWKLASQRLLAAAPSLQEIDGRSLFHLYSQPPLAELSQYLLCRLKRYGYVLSKARPLAAKVIGLPCARAEI
jgi:hypothetical protein